MELTDKIYNCWKKMGVCGNRGNIAEYLDAQKEFMRIYEPYSALWLVGLLEGIGREEVLNRNLLTSGTRNDYEQGFNIGIEVRQRLIQDGLVVNLQPDERIQ